MEENQGFTSSTESASSGAAPTSDGFTSAQASGDFTSATSESFTSTQASDGFTSTSDGFTSSQNFGGPNVSGAATGGFVEKPVNYVMGIIGALPGVVVGIVLWVIISKFGFIGGIAGFLMLLCSLKGFELLGGRLSIPGIVICVVMSLVTVYFAHNISCALEIMSTMKQYGVADVSFTDAYKSISAFMETDDFKDAYFHDLIFGYVLTILAIIPIFRKK